MENAGAPPEAHHLTVNRTARYYTLGEDDSRPRQVWIVCHGHGQLASRFIRRFEPIAERGRLIVAPEALSRYYLEPGGRHGAASPVGATWMTAEDREAEIGDHIGYLDAVYDRIFERADRSNCTVTALGFSQGGATVARWLARGRAVADRLILWGASIPRDIDDSDWLKATGGRPLEFVVGDEDPYFPKETVDEELAELTRRGVEYKLSGFEGGHEIPAPAIEALTMDEATRRT